LRIVGQIAIIGRVKTRIRHFVVAVAGALTVVIAGPVACAREQSQPAAPGSAAPAGRTGPADWDTIARDGQRLFREGRESESIAILDKVVSEYPDFPDAHYELAESHELLARSLRDDPARADVRTRHLEAAAVHYRRFRDLTPDPADRRGATSLLVDVYGPDGLKRFGEAATFARHYIEERPDNSHGYAMLAAMLRLQGDDAGASETLTKAIAALSGDGRDRELAEALVAHVAESQATAPATAERFLADALAIAEREVASDSTRALGLTIKAKATRARATRLEQDPARRRALTAEADRLERQSLALLVGK
jgi:predicted Zn-dependent protease